MIKNISRYLNKVMLNNTEHKKIIYKVVNNNDTIKINEDLFKFIKSGETSLIKEENGSLIYGIYDNINKDNSELLNKDNTYKLAKQIVNNAKSKKINEFEIDFSETENNINLENFVFSLYSNQYFFSKKSKTENFDPIINIKYDNKLINEANLDYIFELCKHKNIGKSLLNTRPPTSQDYIYDYIQQIIAENPNVKLEILNEDKLIENNLNLFHAVGRGSSIKPRMYILSYNEEGMKDDCNTLLLGKGVLFDAGGYNIKPTNFIEDMYQDKAGACYALSTFANLVKVGTRKPIICALAVVENSVSSNSYKPSEIITSYSGKTVEIRNTDAEGRLILADSMSYMQKNYKIDEIIEMSTLTGAAVMALGDKHTALFGNNDELKNKLKENCEYFGDYLWELPITKENEESVKGKHSDLVNSTTGRMMGASTAAAFLKNFVEKDTKWVHLDIAGTAYNNKSGNLNSDGATGCLIPGIVNYLKK